MAESPPNRDSDYAQRRDSRQGDGVTGNYWWPLPVVVIAVLSFSLMVTRVPVAVP